MARPSKLHRILSFTAKPLLVALFVSLLFHYSGLGSSKKAPNRYPHISKTLVVASTKSSNLTWLPTASTSYWEPHVYVTDDPTASLTVPKNKGREAMVILTYIIDNYDALPDVMFFHHDHSQAWHQIFSSSFELAHLNPSNVLAKGYVSPRCLPTCENIIELPGDVVPLNELNPRSSRDVQISTVLHEFFRDERGGRVAVPPKIAAPCCAQFAVSRERVRARGLETWMSLRKWLLETELDSTSSGRVLEYTWHMWFGMPPVL
jgi:hypothetical protein